LPGVAGPKAGYAPILGAEIRTTQDSYFEIVGQVAEGQDYGSRVMALATEFAFGDLAREYFGGRSCQNDGFESWDKPVSRL